ncbi:MAG: hypothetical protein ACX94C_08825 [Phycisphaerales bacterium]
MIKWVARQLSRGYDTDSERVHRVTTQDVTVGFPVTLVVVLVMMIPVLPLLILAEIFELIAALLLLAFIFAAPISLYAIIDGRGSTLTWIIFIVSCWVLLARYVLFPIIKRHPSYKRFVRRLP